MNDWFVGWLMRHFDRHPRSDWPRLEEKPTFYDAWRGNMVMRGIREEEAEAASVALMLRPPVGYGDHPGAIIAIVEAMWADMRQKGEANPVDTRDAAMAVSKDCGDCLGNGLTVRWRQKSVSPDKPPYIVCYCMCPFGRWMEKSHRQSAPDIRKRLYDLAEHPWLNDPKYCQAPVADVDANLDEPHPPCPACGSVLFRIVRESKWHPWEFQCKTCYGPWERESEIVFFDVSTGKPDLPIRAGSAGGMLGMLGRIAGRAK